MKSFSEPKWWAEELERLRAFEYIPKTHLDLFERIFKVHYQIKDQLAKDRIYPPVSQEPAKKILSKGFPLLNFDRIRIQAESLREHFREICSILGKYECSESSRIGTFVKSEEYRNPDLKEFIRKTLIHDSDYFRELSEKTGVDEHTLEFMALALARPIFELAASEMKDMLTGYPCWKNYCPACGSVSFMARIRKEDGMRILQCSLCATEWKFARVKCPSCNNEEQKSLKFFYYHQESPHRLYVCDRCKRYLKCIDERKTGQSERINLFIEDMATLYLDALAREKEYLPPAILQDITSQELTSPIEK